MAKQIGKWKQAELFQQNKTTSRFFPETALYSLEGLHDFLDRYETVFIKMDSAGQGRGIMHIKKLPEGGYFYSGYSVVAEKVTGQIQQLEDLHPILNPFAKFGRTYPYLIQQGVRSVTPAGERVMVRCHVQFIDGQWIVGGLAGNLGKTDDGAVNRHCGAQMVFVEDLLRTHMQMDEVTAHRVIQEIGEAGVLTAQTMAEVYPNREYGIDIGVDESGQPWVFEVNTTPSVRLFSFLPDMSVWRNIVELRKYQTAQNQNGQTDDPNH